MKIFFTFLLLLAVGLGLGYWVGSKLSAESLAMPVKSSLEGNQLGACPSSAFNCVTSDTVPTDSHFILPIMDPKGVRWAKLVRIVDSMEGTELVLSTDDYAYFTFTTKYMLFVFDVEFHNRPREELIAVRAAARVGVTDLGISRRFIENVRVDLGL